jgi:hypothetical protein
MAMFFLLAGTFTTMVSSSLSTSSSFVMRSFCIFCVVRDGRPVGAAEALRFRLPTDFIAGSKSCSASSSELDGVSVEETEPMRVRVDFLRAGDTLALVLTMDCYASARPLLFLFSLRRRT